MTKQTQAIIKYDNIEIEGYITSDGRHFLAHLDQLINLPETELVRAMAINPEMLITVTQTPIGSFIKRYKNVVISLKD